MTAAGIHLHDTQYYLRMGSWVEPELHHRYAHGNILMWHQAAHSPMYSNSSSKYWSTRKDKGLMPDNVSRCRFLLAIVSVSILTMLSSRF